MELLYIRMGYRIAGPLLFTIWMPSVLLESQHKAWKLRLRSLTCKQSCSAAGFFKSTFAAYLIPSLGMMSVFGGLFGRDSSQLDRRAVIKEPFERKVQLVRKKPTPTAGMLYEINTRGSYERGRQIMAAPCFSMHAVPSAAVVRTWICIRGDDKLSQLPKTGLRKDKDRYLPGA